MNARDFVATYVLPAIGMLLVALVRRWAASAIAASDTTAKSDRIAALEHHFESAVALVEANFVRDMKDPTKPGTWDAVARNTARELAIKTVRETAPGLLHDAAADGDLGKLLDGLVERAVLKLKRPLPAHGVPAAAPSALAIAAETALAQNAAGLALKPSATVTEPPPPPVGATGAAGA